MEIEDLINLLAKVKRNRIQHNPLSQNRFLYLLDRIKKGPWLDAIPPKALEAFLSVGQKVFLDMGQNRLTYRTIRHWVNTSSPIVGELPEKGLKEEILVILIACHDDYVLMKNASSSTEDSSEGEKKVNPCKRCGQCCIGPAEGPLSWRQEEIVAWGKDDRDDILYFVNSVGSQDAPRASSLKFHVCPFLRFDRKGLGLCLIHPVKPRECLEFVCLDDH